MAFEDWEKHPDGSLAVSPLLGWDIAVAPMTGLLRIRYAASEAEFETGGQALALVLTPVQLHELSAAALKMAKTIDEQNLGTRQ